jgi:hypothetical protein
MVWDATTCSTICLLLCGVWPSMGIIECTYTSFATIAHDGTWVSMEFEFCQSIEFDSATWPICFGYDQTFLDMVKIGAIVKL